FFSCSRPHRDLHSFPTRRSSDLWADNHIGGAPLYASDYFEQFYEYAVDLVRTGKAYVCDMTPEETDAYRRLGKASCFRDRIRFLDRKSTRLNSSHVATSYAVFCL